MRDGVLNNVPDVNIVRVNRLKLANSGVIIPQIDHWMRDVVHL